MNTNKSAVPLLSTDRLDEALGISKPGLLTVWPKLAKRSA